MKTLKFTPDLCALILSGAKTTTWRLFDDKGLQTGDEIELVNKSTLKSFGVGVDTKVVTKTFRTLEEEDWCGHETYSSEEEMYKTYSGYCGREVGPDTELKIIHFTFEQH